MNALEAGMIAESIGPTSFGFLVWGAILLVAAGFGYIVRTILAGRR